MQPDDAGALLAFFQKLSREDRFFLKEDVASPVVIQRWVDDMDYDRALPIIALDGDTIVADGTLHRSRANARRHIGQIRIAVADVYRNRGLGATLLNDLATIANEHGLERLLLEAVSDHEDNAIKAAEYVGFVRVGSLPGHAKDLQGHPGTSCSWRCPWASGSIGGGSNRRRMGALGFPSAEVGSWRRRPESNRCIEVLQTSALPLGYVAGKR